MSAKRDKRAAASEPASGPARISVGAHPRARASVRRARAWAGLAGFAVVLLLSLDAAVPAFDALWRAVAGGIVAHFGAWIAALALWRRLIVAELQLARRRLVQRDAVGGDAGAEGARA